MSNLKPGRARWFGHSNYKWYFSMFAGISYTHTILFKRKALQSIEIYKFWIKDLWAPLCLFLKRFISVVFQISKGEKSSMEELVENKIYQRSKVNNFSLFLLFKTALWKYSLHSKTSPIWSVYDSMISSKFTELFNQYHSLIFITQKRFLFISDCPFAITLYSYLTLLFILKKVIIKYC